MLPKSTDKVAARSGVSGVHESKPSNALLEASQMVNNHESTILDRELPN